MKAVSDDGGTGVGAGVSTHRKNVGWLHDLDDDEQEFWLAVEDLRQQHIDVPQPHP